MSQNLISKSGNMILFPAMDTEISFILQDISRMVDISISTRYQKIGNVRGLRVGIDKLSSQY